MPLSDHEQRMLDQIESALYAEDPKFASSVRGGTLRAPSTRRRLQGVGLFVLGLVALALGGLWDTRLAVAAVALLALHAGVALAAAGTLVRPWQSPARWVGIAWATVCMHGAYGAGFLHGVIDAVVRRGRAGRAATRLTR